jgi:hypothetical protein
MSKIRKPVIDAVEKKLTGAKVVRGVSKDAKPLRNVLSPVTAKPSRIVAKPQVYSGKPYLSTGRETLQRGTGVESPYSAIKKPYAPEDVQVSRTIANPNVTNKMIIDPASLQGGTMIGWVGDRAQAGTVVDAINNIALENPVRLHGGGDWMLDSSGSIMASNPNVTKAYINRMNKLAESGNPIYSSHLAMSPEGVDFNKMISDMFAGSRGDIKDTDAMRIDSYIKNFVPKGKDKKIFNDFVGINSEDLGQYLSNLSGSDRSAFIKEMDKARMQDIFGIPDVGAIRIAVTDPNLLNVDTMSTGFAIGKYNPDIGLIQSPDVIHPTYSSQIAGDPVGMFGVSLPYDVMFPQFGKKMREIQSVKPTVRADYTATRTPPVQYLDQEWVDSVSQAIENFRKLKEQQ